MTEWARIRHKAVDKYEDCHVIKKHASQKQIQGEGTKARLKEKIDTLIKK